MRPPPSVRVKRLLRIIPGRACERRKRIPCRAWSACPSGWGSPPKSINSSSDWVIVSRVRGPHSSANMNDAEKIMAITKKACEPYVVCIVDDDQAVRDALGNLLESVGLRVEAFASAEEFVNSNNVKIGRAS